MALLFQFLFKGADVGIERRRCVFGGDGYVNRGWCLINDKIKRSNPTGFEGFFHRTIEFAECILVLFDCCYMCMLISASSFLRGLLLAQLPPLIGLLEF